MVDVQKDEKQQEFVGTIIEASDTFIVVEPDEGTNERRTVSCTNSCHKNRISKLKIMYISQKRIIR